MDTVFTSFSSKPYEFDDVTVFMHPLEQHNGLQRVAKSYSRC